MLYHTIECDFCGLKFDDPDRFRTDDEHICQDCLKKLRPDRFDNVK